MIVGDVMVNWRKWKRTTVREGIAVMEEGEVLTFNGNPGTVKLKKITILLGDVVIRSIVLNEPCGGATVENPDYTNMVIG
jgi:hypothetical protein